VTHTKTKYKNYRYEVEIMNFGECGKKVLRKNTKKEEIKAKILPLRRERFNFFVLTCFG
jgi:hypothetical protein